MKTKNRVLALKGLPASGKSTKAKELVEQGWVRSNKDDIRLDKRLFPDGYNYKNRGHEKRVIKERNRIVEIALANGKNVVVDDTNLNPVHIKDLANIAKRYNASFSVDDTFLSVPLWECIERDSKREGTARVGASVIRGMYHQYIKKPLTAVAYDPSLPMAVISDIDGTLAHMDGGRSPFEWSKVGQDRIDEGVAHLLDCINYMGYAKVFIFSGRSDICRKETEEWLEKHDIDYEALYMKPHERVNEDDRVCKREFLLNNIVGKYNVLFVVDDRPKVCRMWRDEFGLQVMQVGDPDFEF